MAESSIYDENRPFEEYKSLFKKIIKKKYSLENKYSKIKKTNVVREYDEADLFFQEMKDVVPVSGKKKVSCRVCDKEAKAFFCDDDFSEIEDVKEELFNLIDKGEGFDVSKTPEYHELIGAGVSRVIAQKLHSGNFSVQDYIDLHGFSGEEAQEAVERFLKKSFSSNKNAVLIVHGRGLSSPKEPVIKNRVKKILSSNYWRRRIFAYTSAKRTDGGAGGTYVLFRNKALTKKEEKNLLKKRQKN